MGGEAVCLLTTTPANRITPAMATPTATTTAFPTTPCGRSALRAPVLCESASAVPSVAARRRSSPRCAGCWPMRSASSWSPTTSSPPKTPRRFGAWRCCPTNASSPSRRAHARTPRSATTSRPTSTPSNSSKRANAPVELTLVESGGDNLTAIFSRALVDRQIFVIDVAGGDKVPRKGGPGVTTADLLVINKTDLAAFVNADLGGHGSRCQGATRRSADRLHLARRTRRRTSGCRLGSRSARRLAFVLPGASLIR